MTLYPVPKHPGFFVDSLDGMLLRIVDFDPVTGKATKSSLTPEERQAVADLREQLGWCGECGGSGFYPEHLPPPDADEICARGGAPPCPACDGHGRRRDE